MHELTLKAKQDHIEKVVRSADPLKGIAELVWNGFDAQATRVEVTFQRAPLGSIDEVIVTDNGTGITAERAECDFGQLGESWKRHVKPTGRALHGKEGRGRLRFFSVADRCRWSTRFDAGDGVQALTIEIRAEALEKSRISDPIAADGATGTIVSLHPLKGSQDWLATNEARQQFVTVFAQFLRLHPDLELWYDGGRIDANAAIASTKTIDLPAIVGPTQTVRGVKVDIVEWSTAMESRKIHFCGENGVVLGSQPARIQAPDFSFSVYATSDFFVALAADNVLELDDLTDQDFARVLEAIRDPVQEHFRNRSAERSQHLIQELKDAGAYPYKDDPTDDVERRERDVFDMATYAVSNYSKEFRRADNSLKRMTLALLREALRHNPDSLTQILRAVVDLPKDKQNQFSSLLERTELSNIISASSLIADRVAFLQTLEQAVFDPAWRRVLKERGGLDALVRDNTWIFGEQFHITLHEIGLTRVMERVANELGIKAPGKVIQGDGRAARLDEFLGRTIPGAHADRHEYLVVELKRPSVRADRKVLNQITDYALTLSTQPAFTHTDTTWTFFLVVGEYDDTVKQSITQDGRDIGIAVKQPNYTVWVKCWSEIIRDCKARLQYIQDRLQVQVSNEEINARLRQLQSSFGRAPDLDKDATES
ncbi:ATP-binding protein [Phenylobacterium sp.]|uniref:ATP-binding protein n=1 Tax=Phenylobacterium sp. TaxID=1871053 RepID=UPI002BBED654|nr:ATP-binding protein [Phenylobacterium sp.]HLZ76441.1 ATP-binding protein [Phenylobacterium sp.]